MKKEIMSDKPTVHKLIQVATFLFAKKGFAGVSVKEIAETANVNIALISYHFGGKENLYATVLEAQLALLDHLTTLIGNEEILPLDKIKRFAQEFVTLHKQHPYTHHLIYGEIKDSTPCYEKIVKPGIIRAHDFFAACLQEAMDLGQLRRDVKLDCANILLASVFHFYFFTNHLADTFLQAENDKAEYYMTEAVAMYLRGIVVEQQ